ncbi:asparagine synthase C-terminal domain-containing protein, partial [bacterium]|nr:asparagine synthase C-terminal domain-containing protein [bacterium]
MKNSSRLLIEELRERLKKAVTENAADGMLFSGGLDTAILAYLNPGLPAVNVRLENYGEDIDYAKILA